MAATYTDLHVHVIFATRSRKPLIDSSWSNRLHAYLAGTVQGLGGKSLSVNGVADHVHLLFGFPARLNVADMVREIKKSSSGWAKGRRNDFHWQEGYAALSLSHSDLSSVRKYIANQEEHHRQVSSEDELHRILAECEIEYDLQYFE